MNDEHLEIINDLQGLLNISYREAYQIVDEYLEYGDVDLSDFDEVDDISQLIPKDTSLSLNIRDNKQETLSQLSPRDREVVLSLLENKQDSISQLLPKEHELLIQIRDNKRDIKPLSTIDKEVELSVLNNNTKIDLLTAKSSGIELDISKSDSSSDIQLLDMSDKELSIDIEFGLPNTPSHVDLDNINPLSISSISSIHEYEPSVNSLDVLSLNNVHTITEIELEELNTLSINGIENITRIEYTDIGLLSLSNVLNIPNIDDLSNIDELSINSLPSIHELNMNEIDNLSLGKLPSIPKFNMNTIDSLSLDKIPNVSMMFRIYKYMPYLTLGELPSITPFDIDSIDTLKLSKLDNFKWGRINARVKRNDLPLLSLNSISDISSIELSELDEMALFDIPEIPNFDIEPIEKIEYESLHLDDNLDILNEITKREVLPPVTKEEFIKAGADPDTVDMYFNDYLSTSDSYNLETMRLFFKHVLTEKDRAIEAGGNYKGLYKIVTEERGTFLPFITELYMTELCQYDEDVGTVIIRYHSMLDGFLINEAHYYNSLI